MPTAPPSRRVIAARRAATGRRTPGRWALLVAIGIGGCIVAEPGPPPVYVPGPRGAAPAAAPHVPPGHLPPPGSCRIWFPDRPPGHQPPPGPCEVLRGQVPPGAWLIQR